MNGTFLTLLNLTTGVTSLMTSHPLLEERLNDSSIRIVQSTYPALSLTTSIFF